LSITAIGHIGICVADMERSVRFWRDGLGFEVLREFDFRGSSWKRVLELDDLDLHTKIIRRDHVTLELLAFTKPGHVGTAERHPMNQLGFTHLAIWVSDLDAAAKRVADYGGRLIEATRTVFDHPKLTGRWLMCEDPNGVRLELVQYPEGEDILERD
jgi:catechol 2,3-dioxygenase-like lactoylglutathione lyase family enzyme